MKILRNTMLAAVLMLSVCGTVAVAGANDLVWAKRVSPESCFTVGVSGTGNVYATGQVSITDNTWRKRISPVDGSELAAYSDTYGWARAAAWGPDSLWTVSWHVLANTMTVQRGDDYESATWPGAPTNIVVDGQGFAYVAYSTTTGELRLRKLGPSLDIRADTLIGTSVAASACGIALDADGNAYVAWLSYISDTSTYTLHVTKVGYWTHTISAPYLPFEIVGGVHPVGGMPIAVSPSGRVYVTHHYRDGSRIWAAVSRIDPDGGLELNRVFGVTGIYGYDNNIWDIAVRTVEGNDEVYLAGTAGPICDNDDNTALPITIDAYQPGIIGGQNGFIAKLDGGTLDVRYCSFVGGATCAVCCFSMALDPSGAAYLGMTTCSPDFPSTPVANEGPGGYVCKMVCTDAPAATSVVDAKQQADGSSVDRATGVVTSVDGQLFYVESPDRACGIQVRTTTDPAPTVGSYAELSGTLATDTATGERFINADKVIGVPNWYQTVKPLYVTYKALGGGDFHYNATTGAGQKGIGGASGWNNIGVLVRTCGYATARDLESTPRTFRVVAWPDSAKVILPDGIDMPMRGDDVIVTGISSCEVDSQGVLHRVLRATDVQYAAEFPGWLSVQYDVYAGWNYVGCPGMPLDVYPTDVFWGLDIEGNLRKYDAPTQSSMTYTSQGQDDFGFITLGDGYMVYCCGDGSVSYVCYPDGMPDSNGNMTDMVISLPGDQTDSQDAGGLHLISPPFGHDTSVDAGGGTGNNILFTDGTSVKTWAQAAADGWVDCEMTTYHPLIGDFDVRCDGLGYDGSLRSCMGYQLLTYKDNLAMIIPAY